VRAGKEWDADIINRSVLEGSIKYVYMMIGSEDEVKEKAREFWEILPSFSAIKRSRRLRSFLDNVTDPASAEWLPFHRLLDNREKACSDSSTYSKKQRQRLEQKWSFSGITKHFLESDSDSLRPLVHLAVAYGMSSHLIHKDGDGVGMVWDRYNRDPLRQKAVRLAHSARIVSDICTFAKIRLHFLLRTCKQNTDIIPDIERKYGPLFADMRKADRDFTSIEYADGTTDQRT
jgi:hypothetical protein